MLNGNFSFKTEQSPSAIVFFKDIFIKFRKHRYLAFYYTAVLFYLSDFQTVDSGLYFRMFERLVMIKSSKVNLKIIIKMYQTYSKFITNLTGIIWINKFNK